MKKAITILAIFAIALFVLQCGAFAQTVTGSLSGTVTDTSGAVVPNATVTLTDQATGTSRTTKSNGAGFYSFPVVQPGTYSVKGAASGFSTTEQKGVTLAAKEIRSVNIQLKVGAESQSVEVSAGAEPVPLTTGASATTLNNAVVSQTAIMGRDAAELIRLMPGMAMNTGLGNQQWTSATTAINSGPIGQFSANGTQPNGSMQLIMNGSVITDSGNQGTQIASINQDMTQEVTFQNGSFDAEHAHGPVTFESVGKRGTNQFHGEGYVYTRNGSFNSNDAFKNANKIKKPIDHYWYTGANLGGPIPIPGFNKNKDRAFFFVGFEHKQQSPAGALHQYMVPTGGMMGGDFSQSSLAPYSQFYGTGGVPCAGRTGSDPGSTFCKTQIAAGNIVMQKDASGNTIGATINPSLFDPNGLILMKLLAGAPGLQSITPTKGYNAQYLEQLPVNGNDINFKIDVNITKNNSAFFSYTRESETDLNSIGLWWYTPASVPYPSSMPAAQLSRTWSVGLTSTISNSLVNEASFGYAYFINPVTLTNPKAVDPATYGYNVKTPYAQPVPQIPAIVNWCCNQGAGGPNNSAASSALFGPGSFGANPVWKGSATGKDSYTPDFSEKLSWVHGKHVMKFGVFWAQYANVQVENACCNGGTVGTWEFEPWSGNSTGNIYADMLLGRADNFSMASQNFTDNMHYNEYAAFAQDSWRVHPRLTVTLGLRFDREGNWFPANENQGIMVWNPTNSVQGYSAASTNPLAGFVWHGLSSSVPLSGWPTPSVFYDPRVGASWDMFGTGRTVLRGGFGIYRYQIAYNNAIASGMLDDPLGLKSFHSNCTFNSLADLASCGAGGASARNTTSPGGMLYGDGKSPYTQTWNVILDQRAPWNSTFEMQYSGNRSRDMLIDSNGNGGVDMANINFVPIGGLFKPDPVTGITYYCQGTPSATCLNGAPPGDQMPHFRPYDYSALNVYRHGQYSNYNGMTVQWIKQTGRAVFNLNYTWGHALGIRGGDNSNGQGTGASLNAFDLASNYGPLAFSRAHIFNASYVVTLGSPIHDNAFLGGVINGWTLSGVTQFQSGPPLQPLTSGNLNASFPGSSPGFPSGVNNQSILGTDGIKLMPYLVCNPATGLTKGQYFNPNCFVAPDTRGVNGPLEWPNIHGPGYVGSDLGIYKTFKITERQHLQFRWTAFNFLNHPNKVFGLGNDVNLSFATPGGHNTNKDTTGVPKYEVGSRVMEFALKYSF